MVTVNLKDFKQHFSVSSLYCGYKTGVESFSTFCGFFWREKCYGPSVCDADPARQQLIFYLTLESLMTSEECVPVFNVM